VDAVAVATPTWDHAEHARYLLRAGRHVLVEKPMASSGAEARELASMASERDAVLAVGHQLLYHPAFESLTLAVAEGSVGEIVGIEAVRTGLVDLGKEPDALWALGPHDIAMILALVGEAPAVRDARAHRSRDRGAIDAVEIDLDLPRGARAAVTLDGRTSERRRRFEVVGSLGRLAFDDGDSGPWLSIAGPDGEERRLAIDAREPLAAECRHFVECASGRSAPRAGGDHGALVASVLERISLAVE